MCQTTLSIVIPVHNKWELTKACLYSLREHAPAVPFELIVVDNASGDETCTALEALGRELFPDAFVRIRNAENRNFAAACNQGAHSARHALLFFLNNDTLLTPAWDGPLIDMLAADSQLGAVGPLLLYDDDTVQHLGVTYAPQGLAHLYTRFPRDHPLVTKPRFVQFLTAAAVLISRELFLACNGFYEDYHNGFEDIDLCVRLGNIGKKFVCVPQSVIYHLESQTRGTARNATDNDALFFARCGDSLYIDAHLHALQDGLAFSIDDLLGVSLHLTEEEEMRLTREADGRNFDDWMRLVGRNPLWLRGREVLAECLEAAGDIQSAGRLRMEMANILPAVASYQQLLRLAVGASGPYWAAGAEQGLERMIAYRKSENLAKAKLAHIRTHCRNGRDILLENAYHKKLRSMGHTGD